MLTTQTKSSVAHIGAIRHELYGRQVHSPPPARWPHQPAGAGSWDKLATGAPGSALLWLLVGGC